MFYLFRLFPYSVSFKRAYLYYFPVIIISVALNSLKLSITSLITVVSGPTEVVIVTCLIKIMSSPGRSSVSGLLSVHLCEGTGAAVPVCPPVDTTDRCKERHEQPQERIIQKGLFSVSLSYFSSYTANTNSNSEVREGVASVPRHDDFFLEKSTRHEAEISPHTRSACRPEQQVFLSLCFTRRHSHHLHTSPTAECNKCVTR